MRDHPGVVTDENVFNKANSGKKKFNPGVANEFKVYSSLYIIDEVVRVMHESWEQVNALRFFPAGG